MVDNAFNTAIRFNVRVAFGNGLIGFRRSADKGWRLFLFDFPSKANNVRESSSR